MISEARVVAAVSRHFESIRFLCRPEGPHDLVCEKSDGAERWVIEAKGETSEPGTDVQTGLGQLLMGMKEDNWLFALALPNTSKYRFQAKKVPARVRLKLKMHLIFVRENEEAIVIAPTDTIPEH